MLNPIELQKLLGEVGFPITKYNLILFAKEKNLDQDTIDSLEKRLEEREYESITDVLKDYGGSFFEM